jgi:hypothetical protein
MQVPAHWTIDIGLQFTLELVVDNPQLQGWTLSFALSSPFPPIP